MKNKPSLRSFLLQFRQGPSTKACPVAATSCVSAYSHCRQVLSSLPVSVHVGGFGLRLFTERMASRAGLSGRASRQGRQGNNGNNGRYRRSLFHHDASPLFPFDRRILATPSCCTIGSHGRHRFPTKAAPSPGRQDTIFVPDKNGSPSSHEMGDPFFALFQAE